ncbi:MAG: antibiotic biosynthesis monooxygenase [Pseudomonadota bacterium]|nr:antibiotic biosynthesis monooxygenase [Pseudomonadota bacterium]
MNTTRRLLTAAALVASLIALPALAAPGTPGDKPLYGLIGSMTAKPGQRAALIAAIAEGSTDMPGCYSYVIAADAANPDLIWITEVWDSKQSHDASLNLPPVQAAIAKAKPLIGGMGSQTITTPTAGGGPRWSRKP